MPVSIKIQQKNEELSVKQQAREQQTREYTRCRQGRAVFTPQISAQSSIENEARGSSKWCIVRKPFCNHGTVCF